MDEQNLFNGYFDQDAPAEPNATAIPEAFAETVQSDEIMNSAEQTVDSTNYQDYTTTLNQTPVPVNYYQASQAASKNNYTSGLAITSLVLGIIGLLILCCFPFATPIFSIVGIILYCVDKKTNTSGVAKAGFVCSLIGLIISVLLIIFCIIVIAMAGSIAYNMPYMYY